MEKTIDVYGASLTVNFDIVDNDLSVNAILLQGINIYEILDQNLVLKIESDLMESEVYERNWKHEEQGCHDYHERKES